MPTNMHTGINGEEVLTEKILDHFSGYENSKPVRIGNAAYSQKQNDIYGILMDAIHAEMKEFPSDFERSEEIWSIVKGIVWVVKNNWQKADKGMLCAQHFPSWRYCSFS